MSQVKTFYHEDHLNKWLRENQTYEIITIQYQYYPSNHMFMVWYKVN